MAFKVVERNGNWGVFRDSSDISITGEAVSFTTFNDLKNNPKNIKNHFKRDHEGKILHKSGPGQ